MNLSLGPLQYYWPREDILAFYEAAENWPVTRIYLGETVCFRRHQLRLPDWLFRRVARQMVAIDPLARSSTWEDLEAGRPTEVDWINGEVVRLAETLGRTAPVNARLVALVKAAERRGRRDWNGVSLYRALRAAG